MMKSALLILTLLFISHSGVSQHTLSGKYLSISPASESNTVLEFEYLSISPASESNTVLEFEDSTFTFTESNGMTQEVGFGKYVLKKDSLILNYHDVINRDSSLYSIVYRKDKQRVSESGQVSITITDYLSNLPFKHASVILRDEMLNPLVITTADSLGKSNLILYPNKHIAYLDVAFIGYYSVSFPVTQFFGQTANINVRLKPATKVYIPKSSNSFRIISATKRHLTLEKNGESVIFTKQ